MNCQPIKYIYFMVPPYRLLCPTHADNKKKQVFEKKICINVLHDQTSVESI